MKGLVFTEFLEMVESSFSAEMADDIIDGSELASGGVYTAVGTYPHAEMVALVQTLSRKTGIPTPALVKTFGRYLFGRFVKLYPLFFDNAPDAFDFLESIEDHVHTEVRKLYPDAELPTFETTREGRRKLTMTYRSRHPFADLAEGLIEGCLEHYQVKAHLEAIEYPASHGTHVEFHITRMDQA
ncbi:heme NO-binding domain-containing protein [Candidatus Thiothrix sp. Deng01]|uniref:Heme NO-binding domain-containing protein n=1 Tax=Candidatus Thiothrix phosphatis TaxID=3112415 RepID=A0ABU6D2G6_9GAMM|nr:heme NO-binding domain-containing protein [Candidatus Thiothrix sp. Deng01]MEB4593276.1 heme NO-binding domain-containing protein [Candidatus Thiothrix sp. Deng01]